jgi:hypothetical protein
MADFGVTTVTDGQHAVALITKGDAHCVNSFATPQLSQGKYAQAVIYCACGLTFAHRKEIEAAKAWQEHYIMRHKLDGAHL